MKRLFTMTLFAVSAIAMQAQGSQQVIKGIKGDRSISATLPEFSLNGKTQMFTREESDDRSSQTFVFFNDDFSQQGKLTIENVSYNYTSKSEEREWVYDETTGKSSKTGEWRANDNSYTNYAGLITLYLNDFDQSCDDFRSICLTQTLFNTDERYEYLLPVITTSSSSGEWDTDGDGQIDTKSTSTSAKMTGFKIMSETGAILQTVTFDDGFYSYSHKSEFDLLKVNGKLYLLFGGYVDEGEDRPSAYLIYAIETNSSSASVRKQTMGTASVAARYTLDGRLTNGEKGINIIRMEDGTTKKVFVK